MKQYIINEEDLRDLLVCKQYLLALENAGVDNWEWYGEAIDSFEKENGVDIDFVEDTLSNFTVYSADKSLDEAEELYKELDNISKT